ncbi:MAG: cytochrome c peroxidase [Ferruginibacter sp.]
MIIGATRDDGYGSYGPTPLEFKMPAGWPTPSKNIFANNKLTEQGFQLGKKLFYDGRLSKDGEISCASCHQQFAAFASFDHDLSHGVKNSFTTRNAPGLANLAWMTDMQWDGSANHIEVQPLAPMTMSNEMGESLDSILYKLKKDTAYKRMFKAAFGDPVINSQHMLKALAQFTGSLVSSNSKYDKVLRGEAAFSPYERRGYELFKEKCASCHKEPLFTDNTFRNNGLSLNRFSDIGRQGITQLPEDSLKFKVPSLRNAKLTFPYMHDGRIYSIPQVIEHYRSGINTDQATLDPLLRNRIQLTDLEKNQLVYFIYTLTDSSFTRDPRFAPANGQVQVQSLDAH